MTKTLKEKIRIEDVNLHYGTYHALKNVNLLLPEKAITAFIGPSGCGKSTLLKSINRMNDLVEGCRIDGLIALDGEDVYSPAMDVNLLRKRVGMVFQKPNPFPMSVYDNIAFGPRTHGIHARKELDRIVERSLRQAAIWDELKDRLGKSALGLSGGQQQRLCIARALAVGPPDGRADICARSHLDRQDRGALPRSQGPLHDRDGHAQHAAGTAHRRPYGLLPPG